MKKPSFGWVVLGFLLLPAHALTKDKKCDVDNIHQEHGYLVADIHVRNLFDEEILKGLRRGMTAAVEYQVQLWKERPHWVNRFVSERIIRMKVGFDTWEQRYLIITQAEEPIRTNEDGVRQRCSHLEAFQVAPLEDMKQGDRYILAVKIILRPMTVENVQEIKRWLAGEVEEFSPKDLSKSSGKKVGDRLLGLVATLTGFGDRVITAKSPVFRLDEEEIILEGE